MVCPSGIHSFHVHSRKDTEGRVWGSYINYTPEGLNFQGNPEFGV